MRRCGCARSRSTILLFFDFETNVLDGSRDEVTMVCTQDYATVEHTSYNFGVLSSEDQPSDALVEALLQDFDVADFLCAFNGIRFDLPFLQQALDLSPDVVTSWVLKTVDPLEFLRLSGHRTSSLDKICTHNQIVSKSSTGVRAIEMARDGLWDELEQ